MKKLIMFLLVHINPNAIFSQVPDTTQPLKQFDASKWGQPVTSSSIGPMALQTGTVEWRLPVTTPDTLRAIVLVTLSPNGIAHSRMGFVVISEGKRPVYLDCRKKALKLPMVGWGYVEVGGNRE